MASAIVLVGGEGRRLGGIDKSAVVVGGRTVLERVLAAVGPLVDEVIAVAGRPRSVPDGVRLVLDQYPGRGSLGGLYSGLAGAASSCGLVLACDLPFLNPDLLAYLVEISGGFDAVVPRTGGHVHTLTAVYTKRCLGPIKTRLQQGHLKIVEFFDQIRVRYVDELEVDRFDPAHLTFFNVNTPEDITRAEQIASTGE